MKVTSYFEILVLSVIKIALQDGHMRKNGFQIIQNNYSLLFRDHS